MPSCASELILNIKKGISKKDLDEKVNKALRIVGLESYSKRPVHTLSGGQKQRLAIASALVSDSNFLLMDEPTAFLDEFSQTKILKIIRRLTQTATNPLTVLWITHRLEELKYSNQFATMKNGRLSNWKNSNNLKKNK